MKRIMVLIMCVIPLFGACSSNHENVEPQKNIGVNTVDAKNCAYTPTLSFSGTLHAFREANLGAALPGRLEKIYFDVGERVEKGAIVAELSGELLSQAEIEYTTLKKDFERASRLHEKGSIPEQQFDHVRAKYEASQAKYLMMKKNTEIRAPFSGMVVEHMLNEGESFFLNPGLQPGYSHASGIVRLMQLDTLLVKIDVNEKQLARLKKGQDAKISCDALSERTFRGQISQIDPILSMTAHTAEVDIMVRNEKGLLKPGMFAYVSLQLPEVIGVVIPRDAIIRQSGTAEQYVFVVQNENTAHRRVITSVDDLGAQIVVRGLDDGQKIVTSGKNKLKDGVNVLVMSGGEL